jgi:hypothetical protein
MRLYPAAPGRRAATLAGDLAVVVLLCLFAWAGVKVHDEIDRLASVGRSVEDSGRGLSVTTRDATDAVGGAFDTAGGAVQGVPLVGGQLADALRSAGRGVARPVNHASDAQARKLIAAGREQERQTHRLARLAGWLTFLIPALLLLVWKLPSRIGLARRLTAAQRALRGAPPEILAARAAYDLPFRTLVRHTPDPFGDLAAGRHAALLAALAEDAGVALSRPPTPPPTSTSRSPTSA